MRHDHGLDASPRCAVYWKWKGVGTLLSNYRPLWTDNLLSKRRRAAYGGTQTPRNTSAPPSKLITLLKPLICFRVPTRLAKQSMCDSNCCQNRVGQRRNRPRLRGIRLTYAVLSRVTDGSRIRDLRSHNPPTPVSTCCVLSGVNSGVKWHRPLPMPTGLIAPREDFARTTYG